MAGEVQFDRERRQNYAVRPDGTRDYHGVPEGYEFDDRGILRPVLLTVLRHITHNELPYLPGARVEAREFGPAWRRLAEIGALKRAPSDAGGWPRRISSPPPGETPRLSVVIAVYNQWRYTEVCLRSLRASVPSAEVVVVDNGSTDETSRRLAGEPIRVLRFPENRGVAPAWNAGLREATGNLLAVLNNDTEIRPGGMRLLSRAAWETGIAAMQGGRLDREIVFAGYTTQEADYPDGCCLLFRRDVWNAVGEFDEGFAPAYSEDSDWGLRAWARGYGWTLCPDTILHHGQRTSAGMAGLSEAQKRKVLAGNAKRMFGKN